MNAQNNKSLTRSLAWAALPKHYEKSKTFICLSSSSTTQAEELTSTPTVRACSSRGLRLSSDFF